MKIVNLEEYKSKNAQSFQLCTLCSKNNKECKENDNICLPLEMLRQLSAERSIVEKLAMIDSIAEYFTEVGD
jgi:hypothetical protein